MAHIPFKATVSGYTGKLLFRWVEASAPLAEVGRSAALDFPYDDAYDILDVNPVVHIVEFWRSDDGIALDELIQDWSVDASKSEEVIFIRNEYKVGRGNTEGTEGNGDYWIDPSNEDTELIDERIDGYTKSEMIVHEAGYGDRSVDEYELRTGGGIVLQDSNTFNQDTRWFITIIKKILVTIPSTTTNQNQYAGVSVVTADRDIYIDSTDNLYNKLVIANKAGAVLTLNFPDLALIPNHTRITFNTHTGSYNYLKLQLDTGDTINYCGQARNVIYIPKCEIVSFYFFDGAGYVTDPPLRALLRGTVVGDMDSSRHTDTGAYLLADESTGVLTKANYPGLYEFIENLPASHFVALGTGSGQWSESTTINGVTVYPYKSKYGIDTISETCRVPHLKNLGARFINTGEYPGRYQHDAVGPFDLEVRTGSGGSSTNPLNQGGGAIDCGFSGMDSLGSWLSNGSYGSEKLIRFTGTETIMKNYGEIPFIVL
jgi:hypothetical protein